MRAFPSIDAHTHIDVGITRAEIQSLGALVMAVTRTLDEAEIATARDDGMAIWGVGCHPGLRKAQNEFDADRFQELLTRTAFAGELGLDGRSRVPMDQQVKTLVAALDVLRRTPRLTSLHSYAATGQLLDLLEPGSPPGIILHWWLGDAQQTQRAVGLGCYFSVNASSVTKKDLLARIPRDRVLTETDHPFGDRRSRGRRPGRVDDVENAIGHQHGMSRSEIRRLVWSNLRQLISTTGCSTLLPHTARVELAANS